MEKLFKFMTVIILYLPVLFLIIVSYTLLAIGLVVYYCLDACVNVANNIRRFLNGIRSK